MASPTQHNLAEVGNCLKWVRELLCRRGFHFPASNHRHGAGEDDPHLKPTTSQGPPEGTGGDGTVTAHRASSIPSATLGTSPPSPAVCWQPSRRQAPANPPTPTSRLAGSQVSPKSAGSRTAVPLGRGDAGGAGLAASRWGWLCTSAGRSRQMGRRGVKISTEIREAFLANQSPIRRNDSLAAQGENTRLRRRMGISREPRVAWLAAVAGGPQPPRPPPCAFVPSCSFLPFPYKRLLAASLPLPIQRGVGGCHVVKPPWVRGVCGGRLPSAGHGSRLLSLLKHSNLQKGQE